MKTVDNSDKAEDNSGDHDNNEEGGDYDVQLEGEDDNIDNDILKQKEEGDYVYYNVDVNS